ncbi:MAG: hypothetical protein WC246_03310 [Candidatus Paceibacterota bacterium]|jgi:hypothetical protein
MALSRKKKIIQVVDIVSARAGKATKIPIAVSHIVPKQSADGVDRNEKERSEDSIRQLDPDTIFGGHTHIDNATFFTQSNKRPSLDEELSGSDFDQDDQSIGGNRRRMRRWIKMLAWLVGVVLVGYALMAVLFTLPRVDVTIVAQKTNWEFHDSLVVNKNINQIDTSTNQIPGQSVVFPSTGTKNSSFAFTPTGVADSGQKARGNIVIVNLSNPAPQKLVATTRFQAPDGKIVRLIDAVTIPGVTGSGPATTTASVVADQPGPAYNIGPIDKLTIPGFAGTSKFDIYYGQIKTPLASGPYPTSDDIAKARSQSEQKFQEVLISALAANVGDSLAVVDGATRLTTTTERIDTTLDANGQFSVYIEGSLQALVFRRTDVPQVLASMASGKLDDPSSYDATNETLAYRPAQTDWKKGVMTLPLDYATTFAHRMDAGAIMRGIAGKGEIDLKTYILSIPGVEKVTVLFWPFWVSSAPKNVDRIHVTVN